MSGANFAKADLGFADDTALQVETQERLQQLTTMLERFALKIGLQINIKKTQVMKMNGEDEDLPMPIIIGNQQWYRPVYILWHTILLPIAIYASLWCLSGIIKQ